MLLAHERDTSFGGRTTVYRCGERSSDGISASLVASDTPQMEGELRSHGAASDASSASSSTPIDALKTLLSRVHATGATIFLPVGYPSSVRPEYFEYQAWDTVQALSSYLRGILSTRAVLESVGVGSESASPLAAAVTWVLRDGAGMIGSLTFTYVAGSSFDAYLKEWRLFADLINDVGLTIDLLTPMVPEHLLLPVMSTATLCKAMCGVSAGATKSSITSHFALRGNMADVAAKENAQETAVTLLGIVAGVFVAQRADELHDHAVYILFGLLTLLHVYANWRGVCALRLQTLNRHRVDISCELLRSQSQQKRGQPCRSLTPAAVSEIERSRWRVWSFVSRLRRARTVVMGCRLRDVCESVGQLQGISEACVGERYLVGPYLKGSRRGARSGRVGVVLHESASALDELKAYIHATSLVEELDQSTHGSTAPLGDEVVADLVAHCHPSSSQQRSGLAWDDYILLLKEGDWDVGRVLLGAGPWRAVWSSSDDKSNALADDAGTKKAR